MFCKNCGSSLQPGEKFCANCGTSSVEAGGPQPRNSSVKGLYIAMGLVVVALVSFLVLRGIPGVGSIVGSAGVDSIVKGDEISKYATFKDGQITYSEQSKNYFVNGQLALEKDGWVYYRSNNGTLEKMKNDGSGKVKLCDRSPYDIFIIGEWIYFRSGNIFRVSQDGKELSQISQFTCSAMLIDGDWIYAVGSNYEGIYKVKVDGSSETAITNDNVRSAALVDDWIYYYQTQHENGQTIGIGLYRIKTDGTNKTLLNNEKTTSPWFSTDGDWINYSIDYNNTYNYYKMRLDGTQKTKVVYDDLISGYVYKDWFYFKNKDDKWALYRMRSDGTSKTKLTDNKNIHEYIITQDWIYYNTGYTSSEDEAYLYKIRTDGTEKKLLLQEPNQMGMNTIHLVGDWIYCDGTVQNFMFSTDGKDRQVLDPPQTVKK